MFMLMAKANGHLGSESERHILSAEGQRQRPEGPWNLGLDLEAGGMLHAGMSDVSVRDQARVSVRLLAAKKIVLPACLPFGSLPICHRCFGYVFSLIFLSAEDQDCELVLAWVFALVASCKLLWSSVPALCCASHLRPRMKA